jgi:hypothetical protein
MSKENQDSARRPFFDQKKFFPEGDEHALAAPPGAAKAHQESGLGSGSI